MILGAAKHCIDVAVVHHRAEAPFNRTSLVLKWGPVSQQTLSSLAELLKARKEAVRTKNEMMVRGTWMLENHIAANEAQLILNCKYYKSF